MKKSARKKNALLLAAVVSGLAFAQPVDAANLAAVVATDYGASQMGAVQGSLINSDDIYATAGILTDLNGDTGIYNTIDQITGKSEMYMRQYTYSTTNLAPSYAFNAQGDWKTDASSGVVTKGANAHGVARSNDYIYIASYDEGTIGVGQVSGDAIIDKPAFTVNIKQDLVNFEGVQFEDQCTLPGEAVMVDGNKLYVLANVNPEGTYWSYRESYLMQYIIKENGSLSYNGAVQMGKNTDSVRLNKYNNMIITNAIGGPQNYGDDVANEDTSLNIAFIDPTTGNLTSSKKVTVPEGIDREMRSIKILPNGAAYVMCYNIAQYGSALNVDVYHTTVANLASDTPADWTKIYSETGAAGWFANLNAEYDTNRVWMEVGDKILVFTDGATTPKVFQVSDFSTNEAYSSANMWTLIETDNVAGDLAKLRADNAAVTNTELLWKDSATQTDPISSSIDFDDNVTISVSDSAYANLTNNILAGVSGNYTLITGQDINIQVENDTATPVGIYAGPATDSDEYADFVQITADKINVITKSPKDGNSLTNAIWVDPSATKTGDNNTLMRLYGDVNIRMEGGMGGNGIAIAKTDRWGEKSTTAVSDSKIEIYGDVSIKGETNQDWGIGVRKDNVLSRFNNAGIVTKVDRGNILVVGDVDLDVYGNGIATVADNSKITIARGGQITVPKGTKYGYYALASYGGDVSMNLGQIGNTVGNSDVNIDGDIFVVKKADPSDASVSLALTTANSHLNGIIDNGSTANLYLQNGATWTNEANNTRYEQDNEDIGFGEKSRVTNFYGGSSTAKAGIINQTKNSKALLIDNYSGNTTVIYKKEMIDGVRGNLTKYANILGGTTTIKSAAEGSSITLRTDSDYIDLSSRAMVEDTLNSLANKLYYTGYVGEEGAAGERNLAGYVELAEGLTTAGVKKAYGDIGFSETDGQGSLKGHASGIVAADTQDKTSFDTPIRGEDEIEYIDHGVLKDDVYKFTKATTITANNAMIPGGMWLGNIGSAISASGDGKTTTLDLQGKQFTVNATNQGSSTGLTAVNKGILVVDNAKDMNITATGTGVTAALFANSGGEIHIKNGDSGVLTARANASIASNGAVIKTMNGVSGVESKILIDGMVDVVADAEDGANEAISAVASRIEIGGGNIEAKNGAWAAIRAYGEFVSTNKGIVNVNVLKDANGNIIGAGDRKTTITGDFVTNGGMGTKGQISVGLNGRDSFWEGNYGDNVGYGSTPGQLGNVNLFVKNGAHWKGFSNGSVSLDLSGEGSYWYGFSTSDKMLLKLTDGAVWQNAISAEQTDSSGNIVDSHVGTFIGDGGYIDMTGAKVFTASSNSLNGSTTSGQNSFIEESTDGITGNLVIDNYSGNTTVIYRNQLVTDGIQTLALDDEGPTTVAPRVEIIGGNITINSAAENSSITLRTDNVNIDTEDHDLVRDTLNSLANRLFYTSYADGERNLQGYVQIAEGLVTSSAAIQIGEIMYDADADGQGSVNADTIRDNIEEPDQPTPDQPSGDDSSGGVIYGDSETAMMRGAKSAMASTAMMWRAENDDMMKRLGEIRNGNGEAGIWAKYYTGKSEMNAQRAKYKTDYTAYQLGYDKQIGEWLIGAAFSYNDGESSYQLGGKGDNSVASLSLYGTKKASNGTYLDLVAKVGRLDTDFTVYNDMFHKLTGDYDTWGMSASAEYGKRFEQSNGFYIDPSVQLTVGRIQGKDYTAASDFLDAQGRYKNMYVHQDSMNSIVGKLGIGIGQKTDRANYFAKFALAHEFGGDFDTNFRADGEAGGKTNIDFGGTWCELEIGGGIQLNDTTMLYATYERSFSGDVKEKYRIDGGVRFSF